VSPSVPWSTSAGRVFRPRTSSRLGMAHPAVG
jgi:hypothetical protein